MINFLLICFCLSSKLEMDEDGYILERSFIKKELDFMVGYDNFQEISMQLFRADQNFELSCIGNLVYLSREDLEDKIDVKFLFEPNLLNFDFSDTKTTVFIAKYELNSGDDSSKKCEIRDLLTIKHVEKNNVIFTNDIKDIDLANDILQLICISKFDEMNYKPCIKNLFTRLERRMQNLDDKKMLLQHYHHLIGVKNLLKNENDYNLFNKILSISSEIQEFEIEYLYKLIAFEITTLCDKIAPNELEFKINLNTLSCVSYLLRILEIEAFFIHELKLTLLPFFICDPKKNMISATKCRYFHKYCEEAFEDKTNEEFYEVKGPKADFFVDGILIQHVTTKASIHYIFVNRN
ncbi:hypothetical protein NBO_611g0003 [Nosema bombycis CQ1]|uniref:Uncharacterized protein n=1 Tax=Nosema bombycis (strain CQ1 / CVCC 102059) TaxID=578461 RepID=R0KP61_NOSB1|nr:hypothetical protein NBO_611g0003 [Nosema bombycis CQ1]|eukprot:EOB11967.1 hypothetical protein NBO_611g0003 [Nosema bombycis CQ1]